jgi:hypothetical protein
MAAEEKKRVKNTRKDSKRKNNLNQSEVDLISDLLTQGWTETDIQLKYGLSWDTIIKAKNEIARQAREYYSNKDLWRGELTRYKQILNDTVASMDGIIEDANTKPSNRRKAEKLKAESMENLKDLVAAENDTSSNRDRAIKEAFERILRRHSTKKSRYNLSYKIGKLF